MEFAWQLEQHQVAFQGYFRIEKYRLRHELYAGGWTESFEREVFERGSAVAVLPYDPVRDRVVFIEQFRIGAVGKQSRPWLREVVAGIVEHGESDEEVAHREADEEAGCTINRLEKISEFFVSPGGTTETCSLYCGEVDSRNIGGYHGLAHEFEDIRVEVVDYEQAVTWLQDGSLNSATPVIAMQWLMLNRERIRAQWCT